MPKARPTAAAGHARRLSGKDPESGSVRAAAASRTSCGIPLRRKATGRTPQTRTCQPAGAELPELRWFGRLVEAALRTADSRDHRSRRRSRARMHRAHTTPSLYRASHTGPRPSFRRLAPARQPRGHCAREPLAGSRHWRLRTTRRTALTSSAVRPCRAGRATGDDEGVNTSTPVELSASQACGLLCVAAEPVRWRLLAALGGGTRCVCELRPIAGVSAPALSHHLRVLREAGLVTAVRRGRWIDYSLAPDAAARLYAALPGAEQDAASTGCCAPTGGAR